MTCMGPRCRGTISCISPRRKGLFTLACTSDGRGTRALRLESCRLCCTLVRSRPEARSRGSFCEKGHPDMSESPISPLREPRSAAASRARLRTTPGWGGRWARSPPAPPRALAVQEGRLHRPARPSRTGIAGKIADTFNEVVELNERMSRRARAASAASSARRARSTSAPPSATSRAPGRASVRSVNDAHRRPGPPDERDRARHRRRRQGRPLADDGARDRRAGRCRASSCAPPRPSTRWSTSSARSPRR